MLKSMGWQTSQVSASRSICEYRYGAFWTLNDSRNFWEIMVKIRNTGTLLGIAAVVTLVLTGCAGTQGRTGERVLGGAALGGIAGAAVGSQSANAGKGAAIGAGIGALGGALYDADQESSRPPPRQYPAQRYPARNQPYGVPNG
ncbi:glycine zipper domain-containing protein [Thiorhodovibrio frisius]|uniref:glycine zipper domain-containing protein n=1 Tax=Thiorhodovibrio frisius TaxID=631362 RepID=UPI0028BD31C1|nr:glycine zipper domain-containing protein [Thiorhodovibrio frisius]